MKIQLTTTITTEYFYDVIAELLNINIEDTDFIINAVIVQEEDLNGYIDDVVEVETVDFDGKELDLPYNALTEICNQYYDEILDDYYEATAKSLCGNRFDLNNDTNRDALRYAEKILNTDFITTIPTRYKTELKRQVSTVFDLVDIVEDNKEINTAHKLVAAAKLYAERNKYDAVKRRRLAKGHAV